MKVTLIPGDGIGPEITKAAVRCIQATGVSFDWDKHVAGESALSNGEDSPLPAAALSSIRKNKLALKGPTSTPSGKGFRSVNVALRKELDLFANVRPARIFEGVKTNFKDVDIITVRENLEDLYIGIEYPKGKYTGDNVRKDAAVSLKVISEKNTKRIVEFAFETAIKMKRTKVTAVHKANILKETDGLFLRVAQRVAKKYPTIQFEDRIVDNMSMQLAQKPEQYDVLVCPNLYGDIISDLCSGIVGGLGVAPSMNVGKDIIVFEPVHGSAPKYAGKDKVNPTSMILCGVMLLRHVGKNKEADRLENAVRAVIKEGKYVTYDINPTKHVGTQAMADAIIERL